MKPLLLLSALGGCVLFSGCEALIVERHHSRPGYVERDDRYRDDSRRDGRYRRDDRPRDRVVVVNERSGYVGPRARTYDDGRDRPYAVTEVRYYSDSRGRYYIRDGQRIYVR